MLHNIFSFFTKSTYIYNFLLFFFHFYCGWLEQQNLLKIFYLLIMIRSHVLALLRWSVQISNWEYCCFIFSIRQILFCVYGTAIICTVLSRSPFPLGYAYFCIPFQSICWIHLWYDWHYHLLLQIMFCLSFS